MTKLARPGREAKTSLVDVAEEALRRWLATGRHRVGERLPPEQELSGQLGISRGTLRTALGRLEQSGEIVRRQGSGTFVGRAASWALDEGLEKLVSYSELAHERGVRLEVGALAIEEQPLGADLGRLYELDPATPATTVTRVLLMDGRPGASMRDVIRPDIELPPPAKLRQALERGQMVLDVLLKLGVPVAYNRSHIVARVLTGDEPVGTALGVTETTAALEIEHVTCTAEGTPVEHSTDIFLPRSLDLHVVRWLEDVPPVPAIGRARGVAQQ
ncbi:MAG: GntR family transcriptional regulator [Thermoleophilaceae bacterium]|jgi:GntR family transcriptional regulator|nr:GntR family transcriptional regulator [Thermoleophilaceae bacterium]